MVTVMGLWRSSPSGAGLSKLMMGGSYLMWREREREVLYHRWRGLVYGVRLRQGLCALRGPFFRILRRWVIFMEYGYGGRIDNAVG